MKPSILNELQKAIDLKAKEGNPPMEELRVLFLGTIATALASIADDIAKEYGNANEDDD